MVQATVLIWEQLEQMRYVGTGDVDFDSFGMAPWDAGGMHGNDCQRRETFRTIMLQWLTVNAAVVPASDYERT